ncbi:MAG: NAD-dependent epimerase/dehydratase family protein [Gallionellaceae bacterium]|nr:NAD-dependent epimerase/dehydratase family protein [Gallionellaceae bacterium]
MRILILGGDGYLGWPTAMYLSNRGHEVAVVDNMVKRFWEAEIGVQPLISVRPFHLRAKRWENLTGKRIQFYTCDIASNHRHIYNIFEQFQPDTVIHYAEQPSAPFSMIDREKCVTTQQNNVVGTLNIIFAIQHTNPDIHLIKLGTMGEYGTPNIDIEEGWLDLDHNGRHDRVLYPKKPHSFYHLSKVHDSANLEFVCRVWGSRVTDLNQGCVYGIDTDETAMHPELNTSFHYDAVFGTVINRFVIQASRNLPLTVYGSGTQTRGYLNIRDTLRCVELAALNPAERGEFRVFNQFTEQFDLNTLAKNVHSAAAGMGLPVNIDHIANPRVEQEQHYYNAKHSALLQLGLEPHLLTQEVLAGMLETALLHKDNVDESKIMPNVKWKS